MADNDQPVTRDELNVALDRTLELVMRHIDDTTARVTAAIQASEHRSLEASRTMQNGTPARPGGVRPR